MPLSLNGNVPGFTQVIRGIAEFQRVESLRTDKLLCSQKVTSSTLAPSLHRFAARSDFETIAYGYEVIASPANLSECVQVVAWIDCWCPDAAQFILFEAFPGISLRSCSPLLAAIDESHLGPKLRLVLPKSTVCEPELSQALNSRGVGLLAADPDVADLVRLTQSGIVGIRVGASHFADAHDSVNARAAFQIRDLNNVAHRLGLRAVASQIPGATELRHLFSAGFDYVSVLGGGVIPRLDRAFLHGRVA